MVEKKIYRISFFKIPEIAYEIKLVYDKFDDLFSAVDFAEETKEAGEGFIIHGQWETVIDETNPTPA